MKKIKRVIVIIVIFIIMGVGLLLLRNYQMEAGVRAYKEENGALALKKLKPLASLGDKSAQMILGYLFAYGLNGVPQNDDNAIYWFSRCGSVGSASDDGQAPAAQHELAVAKAYMNGSEGVKVDLVKSEKWLQLAAKGGSKEAAAMLAKSPLKNP